MTMKECREALTKPAPSEFDPRRRLRDGFKSSMDDLIAGMQAQLSDVVDLEDSHVQLVKRLCIIAVNNTWFDFEMHRCRLMISLTGTSLKTTAEKMSHAQRGPLVLTLLPRVARYGNVDGVGLDNCTIISGCEGNELTIS